MKLPFLIVLFLCSTLAIGNKEESCGARGAVQILLDGSGSISADGFNKSLQFAKSLTEALSPSPDGIYLGLIQFSSSVRIESSLSSNMTQLLSTIPNIYQLGGSTYMASAITAAHNDLRENEQINVNFHLVFLITDGKPTDSYYATSAAAEELKQDNVTLICIGVGSGTDNDFLGQIASQPASQHVQPISNFDMLLQLIERIQTQACTHVTSITPTHAVEEDTSIIVNGVGFKNNSELSCKFGNDTVKASHFFSSKRIVCPTPPSRILPSNASNSNASQPMTFSLEVSLDGTNFTQDNIPFTQDIPCLNDCSGHGSCVDGSCVCTYQYEGEDCSDEVPDTEWGLSEECSETWKVIYDCVAGIIPTPGKGNEIMNIITDLYTTTSDLLAGGIDFYEVADWTIACIDFMQKLFKVHPVVGRMTAAASCVLDFFEASSDIVDCIGLKRSLAGNIIGDFRDVSERMKIVVEFSVRITGSTPGVLLNGETQDVEETLAWIRKAAEKIRYNHTDFKLTSEDIQELEKEIPPKSTVNLTSVLHRMNNTLSFVAAGVEDESEAPDVDFLSLNSILSEANAAGGSMESCVERARAYNKRRIIQPETCIVEDLSVTASEGQKLKTQSDSIRNSAETLNLSTSLALLVLAMFLIV